MVEARAKLVRFGFGKSIKIKSCCGASTNCAFIAQNFLCVWYAYTLQCIQGIKIAKGVIAKVSYTALNMRVEACSAIKSTQKKYLRKFQDFVLSPIHKDVTCVFVTCVFATAC